ncbi:MAG: type II toxin-antitoxin system RelE/ParE family toxin [Epsilonproteobacteria bacterium]|nr:type II toxin-antitoxin system RelE/ParE family toxin [Campylobacterota bacterium]
MKREVKLTYLKKAKKFLDKNQSVITEDEVDALVLKSIQKSLFNIETNIDCKQLQGELRGYYRIRKGNVRIIIQIRDNEILIEAIINDIGFRGDVYK